MRVYTVLTHRDKEGLAKFVQSVRDIGATGVTIFTRPEMVYPDVPEGMESEEDLQKKMDLAAVKKDFKEAVLWQQKIDALKTIRAELAKKGCDWIADIVAPIKHMTQLVVLGNVHWPATDEFTQKAFMSKLEPISTTLLSTGIGGIRQITPLHERTFIPLPGGHGVQGEPATGPISLSPFETKPPAKPSPPAAPAQDPKQPKSKRHPALPQHLSEKQSQFATYRLGLDRGGLRRSRNEAGNMLGYSPNIAAKMENSINSVWKEFSGIIASSDVLA